MMMKHTFKEEAKDPYGGEYVTFTAILKTDSPEGAPGSRRWRCKLWIGAHR